MVPDEIDISFLQSLKKLLLSYTKKGLKFILIVGGGKTTRRYQVAARSFPNITRKDQDDLGITTIHSNVHLLKLVFKGYEQKIKINPDLATWKPGSSSDLGAVHMAQKYKAKILINLTNTDGVYNKDPKKYKNAKRFNSLTWSEFRKILPSTWGPGLSTPFDPIAARVSEHIGLTVYILNGKKLKEFEKVLKGESFLGTTIC